MGHSDGFDDTRFIFQDNFLEKFFESQFLSIFVATKNYKRYENKKMS
jgi:hypothetical protein